MEIFAFGEFVDSNNFFLLFSNASDLYSTKIGFGQFLQGFPTKNIIDWFWGSNSGIRTLPLLLVNFVSKSIFGSGWFYGYLLVSLLTPFLSFMYCFRDTRNKYLLLGSSLLYGFNPWVIEKISTGVWQQVIAYGMLPFLYKLLVKRNRPGFFSTIVSIVLLINPMYLIIFFIPISYFFVLDVLRKRVVFWLKVIVWIFFVNAYWFVPSFIYPEIRFMDGSLGYNLSAIRIASENQGLIKSLNFGHENSDWVVIPILIMVLSMRSRSEVMIKVSLVFLLFLSLGIQQEYRVISEWIFSNIPIINLSRDVNRYVSGIVLMVSLLIIKQKDISKTFSAMILVSIVFFVTSSAYEVSKERLGLIQSIRIPEEYIQMQKYINTHLQNSSGRIAIVPSTNSLTELNWFGNRLLSPSNEPNIWGNFLPLKISIANGNGYPDSPYSAISKLAINGLVDLDKNPLINMLDAEYVLVDSNVKNFDPPRIPISTIEYTVGKLTLYKLNKASEMSFPRYLVGSYSDLVEINKNEKVYRPTIILNQLPLMGFDKYHLLPKLELISRVDNPMETFAAEMIEPGQVVDLISKTRNYKESFYPFEQYKFDYKHLIGQVFTSGRSIISSHNSPTTFPVDVDPGDNILLIKSSSSSDIDSSVLHVGLCDYDLIVRSDAKLSWKIFPVYVKDGCETLSMKGEPDLKTVVDKVIIVSRDKWQSQLSISASIIDSITGNPDSNTKIINHRQLWSKHWDTGSDLQVPVDGYSIASFHTLSEKIRDHIEYKPEIIYDLSKTVSVIGLLVVIAKELRS